MSQPRPETLLSTLKDWVADPRVKQRNFDGRVEKIEQNFGVPENVAHIFISMASIGGWHCANGHKRLLDGDRSGMEQVRLGVGYLRSAMVMKYRNWQVLTVPTKRLTITPFQSAHVIACGLATYDPDANRLKGIYLEGLPDDFLAAPMLTYPRFIRALLWLERGMRIEVNEADYGPYAPVLSAWEGGEALARALTDALDYHVERTQPRNRDDLAEFEDIEVFAWPAEVLAVLRLRERLGLPNPSISHPLLDCGFAEPLPAGQTWPRDDLLIRCEQVLQAMG